MQQKRRAENSNADVKVELLVLYTAYKTTKAGKEKIFKKPLKKMELLVSV